MLDFRILGTQSLTTCHFSRCSITHLTQIFIPCQTNKNLLQFMFSYNYSEMKEMGLVTILLQFNLKA